jgi:acyl phosphate:glycerol-3-phosphate acyltransferase
LGDDQRLGLEVPDRLEINDLLLILAGYIAGSLPFGYWLVLLVRRDDIRKYGSGNIGATNVWRSFGPGLGAPVIVLDIAKGFVPTLVAVQLEGALVGALVGGAAMLGHWRPVFMRFRRGGKMVATCAGALFGLAPVVGLASVFVWLVVFALARYASLASIAAAVALPFAALALGEPWPVVVFVTAAAVGVLLLHRTNIARLRAGTENRFDLRRLRGQPAR